MKQEKQQAGSAVNIGLWIAQVLLAGVFGMAGAMKLTAPIPTLVQNGMTWAASMEWFVRFLGASELLGAIGMLVPSLTRIQPRFTVYAAYGIILVMVSAAVLHLANAEYSHLPPVIVIGLVAGFVAHGRRVLAPIEPKS